MSIGFSTSKLTDQHRHNGHPEAVVVNVSVSGSRLGGAAIAAEWHSRFLAKDYPVELWRMWDEDTSLWLDDLKIRNFNTRPRWPQVTEKLPRRAKALIFESDILPQLLHLKPAIVHLQNPGPAIEFERIARACQQNGIKVVASTHGFYEIFYPNYGLKWYEKLGWNEWLTKPIQRSFPYIDAFLSGYPAEQKLLLTNGVPASKIHLVPNGINPFFETLPTDAEREATLRKFDLVLDQPTLLFIGNHTANKGLDAVIDLAASLKIPATVVIGGKLRTPDEPKQWQAQMPSNSPVRLVFTDYLSNAEQRVLYNVSTLLLFPSLADTLPLTILEAMACGLPVVAYDTGGIAYQLAEAAGVVVKQGDVVALKQVVQDLLNSPQTLCSIGAKAKARQQALFSWDLAARKTIQIYQTLASLR
jgi:alpha-maltose-1-phosphate synthase